MTDSERIAELARMFVQYERELADLKRGLLAIEGRLAAIEERHRKLDDGLRELLKRPPQ